MVYRPYSLLVCSVTPLVYLSGLGMARKGGTITSTGGQQQLDVQYHCQRPGEAIVTVTIPLEIYEDVTFSFRKACNKKSVVGCAVQCPNAPVGLATRLSMRLST